MKAKTEQHSLLVICKIIADESCRLKTSGKDRSDKVKNITKHYDS